MPCEVDIHAIRDGEDKLIGTIGYDEDVGHFFVKPTDEPLLDSILTTPIYTKDGEIDAVDDPEAFMEGLCRHYKSFALRASEVREVD